MIDGMTSTPLTSAARPEKALWYQEVLALDPHSRIFLPYARLLAELGRPDDAIDVLKTGLARHPEFLEARLLLIDLLHSAGMDTAAGLEASGIIELLAQSSALWEIWSRQPGLRADQAAMLLFFGSSLKHHGISLAEVFEAGIQALSGEPRLPKAQPSSPSAPHIPTVPEQPDTPASTDAGTPSETEGSAPADTSPAFVMDDSVQWYSLDSVPDDDDIYDDEEPAPGLSNAMALMASFQNATQPSPENNAVPRAPRTVPRTASEGKCSLCTRSMADVLEEQGAVAEAADIYRELLEHCSSLEERAELQASLERLQLQNDTAQTETPSGLFDMLEELAARLENKSRADA